MHVVERYHDISTGHRVHNHESKCAHLHGHNYRVHFKVVPGKVERLDLQEEWMVEAPLASKGLDSVGRVIDFSVVKDKLCMWLEDNWDHKFLVWDQDPMFKALKKTACMEPDLAALFLESIVLVPFNPTAENMAQYLVDVIGPKELHGTGVMLRSVRIEETRKCSVHYIKEGY